MKTYSDFAHIPICIGILLVTFLIGANPWAALFAGIAVCFMREVTQEEYRWIEEYGHGLRANMPFGQGLKFWQWNKHSILETVYAALGGFIVAVALHFLF